jgi:2-hydroxychromene-2-carboxylate isomerase
VRDAKVIDFFYDFLSHCGYFGSTQIHAPAERRRFRVNCHRTDFQNAR